MKTFSSKLFILSLILFLTSSCTKDYCIITGWMEGIDNAGYNLSDGQYVYLLDFDGEKKLDSTIVKDGSFTFLLPVKNKAYARTIRYNTKYRPMVFFIEGKDSLEMILNVEGIPIKEIVRNSPLNDLYTKYRFDFSYNLDVKTISTYNNWMLYRQQLDFNLSAEDEARSDKDFKDLHDERWKLFSDIIKGNSENVLSEYIFFKDAYHFNKNEIDSVLPFLREDFKKTEYFKASIDKIQEYNDLRETLN